MSTDLAPPRDPEKQRLFEQVFDRILDVSSLPTVATQIIHVAGDSDSTADDLLHVVQGDAAITVRVLRTVNSAYYGLGRSVTNLKSAITLLGFKEVRNLALTVYVANLFKIDNGFGIYSREQLWNHLTGVASAARLIARACGRVAPEEAYLAGLLHDLGIILIDQHLHRLFCQVVVTVSEEISTCRAEQNILDFDHAELGAHAAAKWAFPESIASAIRFHHTPERCEGESRSLVQVVALANYLCSRTGLTSIGVHNVSLPDETCFSELGISKDRLSTIWEELEPTLEGAAVLAEI